MFCQSPMCLSRANPYLLGPLALWQEWSYVESIALLYFMNTSMYSVDWFHWLWNWNMYKFCKKLWAKCSELKFSLFKDATKNSSRCFTSLGWPFLQHLGSRGSPKCNIDKGHRLWLRTCPWGLGFDGNFGWFIEMFKNQQAFWIYLCNQLIW